MYRIAEHTIRPRAGRLRLLVRESAPEAFEFSVQLFNVSNVTGIHLHLPGNSSSGLYGEQLLDEFVYGCPLWADRGCRAVDSCLMPAGLGMQLQRGLNIVGSWQPACA